MWGIHDKMGEKLAGARITPTCVGNTQPSFANHLIHEDHPHMCGEYGHADPLRYQAEGSPPHVWGILEPRIKDGDVVRITPTCVGNTTVKIERTWLRKDHPHMCGEYRTAERRLRIY